MTMQSSKTDSTPMSTSIGMPGHHDSASRMSPTNAAANLSRSQTPPTGLPQASLPALGSALAPGAAPAGPGAGAPNTAIVQSLSQAINGLLPQLGNAGANGGVDLVQLGMGIGMSLQAQGILNMNSVTQSQSISVTNSMDEGSVSEASTSMQSQMSPSVQNSVSFAPLSPAGGGGGGMGGILPSMDPHQAQQMQQGNPHGRHPIGVVDPTASTRTAKLLDHRAEQDQVREFREGDRTLTTEEQYKGMQVVDPSETPDEETTDSFILVSREDEARKQVPVFAYPPELLGQDYKTHPVAGVGTSFVMEKDAKDQTFVEDSKVGFSSIPPRESLSTTLPVARAFKNCVDVRGVRCVHGAGNHSAGRGRAPGRVLQIHPCHAHWHGGG